jgi:hypothetical protein
MGIKPGGFSEDPLQVFSVHVLCFMDRFYGMTPTSQEFHIVGVEDVQRDPDVSNFLLVAA